MRFTDNNEQSGDGTPGGCLLSIIMLSFLLVCGGIIFGIVWLIGLLVQ